LILAAKGLKPALASLPEIQEMVDSARENGVNVPERGQSEMRQKK
jgi:hypothetical protein